MRAVILVFLRFRIVVVAVAALGALLGLWALLRTPIDALPDLSENQVLVYTPWPGQQPPTIERQVTSPLSQALTDIPDLESIRGSSDAGFSLLHLLFADHVSLIEARNRVQARLSGISLQLPEGVVPQVAADGIPIGQIFWYTVEGTSTDLVELRRIQESQIAPALMAVEGVAEVATVGGFQPELHVRLDLDRATESAEDSESFKHVLQDPSAILEATPLLATMDNMTWGTAPRSGIYEKDGNEVVAGVVHLKYGHNPLAVTEKVLDRLTHLSDQLPPNIRVVPCYDRTPLIRGGIRTVTRTLLESILVTTLGILFVLRHWRTSLVISLTLPLSVLMAFLAMAALRGLGIVDVQTNIMSLAGIVVSIGVLIDSAIVITDNVTHELHRQFGNDPVTGDTSQIIARACAKVGWPAFLSILVMLISFLPVFALRGIDGRMYAPLAWTKALSLMAVAVLTLTLVPVLCYLLIRGRVRAETESALIAGFARVYRPMLSYFLDHPLPLVWFLGIVAILGAGVTGSDWLVRAAVGLCALGSVWLAKSKRSMALAVSLLVLTGFLGPKWMRPIALETRVPLDEGMVMDMPITIPNLSVAQAVDDLKARNMVLCRFPEVAMVSGKAGRAESAFDPAPLEMIETMVEFRPQEFWPHRRLDESIAEDHAERVIVALRDAKLVEVDGDLRPLAREIVESGLPKYNAIQREICFQRLHIAQTNLGRELAISLTRRFASRLQRSGALSQALTDGEIMAIASNLPQQDIERLGHYPERLTTHALLRELKQRVGARYSGVQSRLDDDSELLSMKDQAINALKPLTGRAMITLDEALCEGLREEWMERWGHSIQHLNEELRQRAAIIWTQLVCSELIIRKPIVDDGLRRTWTEILDARHGKRVVPLDDRKGTVSEPLAGNHHHNNLPSVSDLPIIEPHRAYSQIIRRLTESFASRVWLWPHDRKSLTGSGGELDESVQMPGWANVWTRPIQNRVDMLASGVNSEVGLRVTGDDFDTVYSVSEAIAHVLSTVPGAANVIADPIRGKDYTEYQPNESQLEGIGIDPDAFPALQQLGMHGRMVGKKAAVEFGDSLPSNLYPPLEVPVRLSLTNPSLEQLAETRVTSGPASIKSENGRLRNYVRMNVRDRDPSQWIMEAQKIVRDQVSAPPGIELEWTGQYLHADATRRRLLWIIPVVFVLICLVLYAVFRDFVDMVLVFLAVPSALAGGILCQWLFGFPFSIAVGIGYISCFGMAAATGIIMLVYLRDSVAQAGDLRTMPLSTLRSAVLNGAVHRMRPKLLTEATMICSLVPMLWSNGPGADIIRPMAAPVLGGILIADEVIDLLVPVLFYASRRKRLASRLSDGSLVR